MEGIITILILYFVFNVLFKKIKSMNQPAKQTQEQPEGIQPRPFVPETPKRDNYRFPPVAKTSPKPVFQEGREPKAVMGKYTPILASADMQSQFSENKGSLHVASTEGIGYQAAAYEPSSVPYRTYGDNVIKVLPENFNRDTLLQAVVMSEILKRPRVRR